MFNFKNRPVEAPECRCGELEERLKDLEAAVTQQKKWAQWQANASNTGGQFGFSEVIHPLGDVQA